MKEFICIVCPRGCHINVSDDNEITNYGCPRGLAYVKQEMVDPKRMVTSTVVVKNRDLTLLPIKTSNQIPKNKIFDLMKVIKETEVLAPIKVGDVIISNVLNLGVDIISCKEIK